MSIRRTFLYALIASVSVSALIGIGVLLLGNFGTLETRVLLTTLTVTVTSILGLACGAYFESGRGHALPLAGIVLSVVAAAFTILLVWDVGNGSTVFIKTTATITLLAISCAHLSLLSLARLDNRFAWSRLAAFVFIAALDAILLWLLWFEPEGSSDIVARTIGILSILIAAVTVVTPVFHKLSASDDEAAELDAEIEALRTKLAELESRRAAMGQGAL